MRKLLTALLLMAVAATPALGAEAVHPPISIRVPGKLPLDLCRNFPGIQLVAPPGYHLDLNTPPYICVPN